MTKFIRLKILEIAPTYTPTLIETWTQILNEHIYEADALQICTCRHLASDVLLSGDEKLINTALKWGLKAVNVKEESRVRDLLSGSYRV